MIILLCLYGLYYQIYQISYPRCIDIIHEKKKVLEILSILAALVGNKYDQA